MDAFLGKALGAYRIEALLGQGGMGTVYRARDAAGRFVAIKILGSEASRNGKLVERFRREAHAGRTLRHPHLVPVIDAGEYIGRPYLVMDYVEGRSLDIVFEDRRRLMPAEVLRLAEELGSALAYLHGSGFYHRDLKPANVLVDGERRARLTDFGLVKAAELYALTQDGTLLGTMHYIPPEVLDGAPHSAASDIYQLGLILYEAATGDLPFGLDDLGEALKRRREGLPSPVRAVEPAFPAELDSLILNCLFPDPRRRYHDGGEFYGDVERCRRGRKVRRRRAVVDGAEALAAGASAPTGGSSEEAGLSLASFAAASFHQESRPPRRPPRRASRGIARPSGAVFAPSPPEEEGAGALFEALRSLPRSMVVACVLSLLFVFLAFRPWQFFGADRSEIVARDTVVRRGVRRARVGWTSRVPYASVLLLRREGAPEGSGRRVEGEPRTDGTHRVELGDLEPGTRYTVEILYPDGSRSIPTPFQTGRSLSFGRHEMRADGTDALAVVLRSSVPSLVDAKVFLRGRLVQQIDGGEELRKEHVLRLRDLPHPFLSATMVVEAKNHVGENFPANSVVVPSLADLVERDCEAIDLHPVIDAIARSHGDAVRRRELLQAMRSNPVLAWIDRLLPVAEGVFSDPGVGLDRKIALANALSRALLVDEALRVIDENPVFRAREVLRPFLSCGRRTAQGEDLALLDRVGVVHRLPPDADLFIPANAPPELASRISAVSEQVTALTMRRREYAFDLLPSAAALGDAPWVELGFLFRDDGVPGYWRVELDGSLILPLPNAIRRVDVPKRNVFETAVDVFGHHGDGADRHRTYVWCRFPRFLLREGRNRLRIRYGSYLAGTCYPAFLSTVRVVSVAGTHAPKAR